MDSSLGCPGAPVSLGERAKPGRSIVTSEERAALLDGLYEEDHSVDMLEYHAKVLGLVEASLPGGAKVRAEEREDRARDADVAALERAVHFLQGHVARLCHIIYAGNYAAAKKAERFYADLPPGDGDEFVQDWLLPRLRAYAGQFPQVGTIPKRAEVTEAMREVIDGN